MAGDYSKRNALVLAAGIEFTNQVDGTNPFAANTTGIFADNTGTAYLAKANGTTVVLGQGSFEGVYTNATRPAATTIQAGHYIFNTDDKAPNFSDGTNWYDATGILT